MSERFSFTVSGTVQEVYLPHPTASPDDDERPEEAFEFSIEVPDGATLEDITAQAQREIDRRFPEPTESGWRRLLDFTVAIGEPAAHQEPEQPAWSAV